MMHSCNLLVNRVNVSKLIDAATGKPLVGLHETEIATVSMVLSPLCKWVGWSGSLYTHHACEKSPSMKTNKARTLILRVSGLVARSW